MSTTLYAGKDPAIYLSREDFNEYCQTAEIVASEAISDYLYKIKDTLATIKNSTISNGSERVIAEALSHRYQVEHVIKRLNFINVKDHTVQKPENFTGKYIDYTKDLLDSSEEVIENTIFILNSLKLALASVINDNNSTDTIYGDSYFREATKIHEKRTKLISKYFKHNNSSTKAEIGDLLKSLKDIPTIYSTMSSLPTVISEDKIRSINKLAEDVSGIIDLLLENTSTITDKSSSVRKDLVNGVYVAARQVELSSYLYTNVLFLSTAVLNLSETLLKLAK